MSSLISRLRYSTWSICQKVLTWRRLSLPSIRRWMAIVWKAQISRPNMMRGYTLVKFWLIFGQGVP